MKSLSLICTFLRVFRSFLACAVPWVVPSVWPCGCRSELPVENATRRRIVLLGGPHVKPKKSTGFQCIRNRAQREQMQPVDTNQVAVTLAVQTADFLVNSR